MNSDDNDNNIKKSNKKSVKTNYKRELQSLPKPYQNLNIYHVSQLFQFINIDLVNLCKIN
jgi:hypothetical protein